MELALATAIGVLTAIGIYLLLRARSFDVILGMTFLSYATNLLIFAGGGWLWYDSLKAREAAVAAARAACASEDLMLLDDTVAITRLGFGRDERVQVRALPTEQKQGSTGFTGSRQQRVESRRWEVRNLHRTPVTVQLLDAAPVAEQQDIRVESRYSPEPASTRWNGQPGSVLWELALPPGTTQQISTEHRISWPQDMRLRERR